MINERHMSFTEAGEGFPVLMGHSYLFDRTMWTPQVEALSDSYRIIIPDLWGHGQSPTPPTTMRSLTDMAITHLQLMDSLGIEEFAVVGLSVGGMWGAELAALAPDRVKALMLLDTFVGSDTPEAQQRYAAMLNAVEASGAIQSPLLEYIISQFYSAYAMDNDVVSLKNNLTSLSAEKLRTSIVPIGRMIFNRQDRMAILDKITCPVYVATGEFDLPRPPAEGKLMADRLNCDFTLLPHAGHISNREQPERVTMMIKTFLAQTIQV